MSSETYLTQTELTMLEEIAKLEAVVETDQNLDNLNKIDQEEMTPEDLRDALKASLDVQMLSYVKALKEHGTESDQEFFNVFKEDLLTFLTNYAQQADSDFKKSTLSTLTAWIPTQL